MTQTHTHKPRLHISQQQPPKALLLHHLQFGGLPIEHLPDQRPPVIRIALDAVVEVDREEPARDRLAPLELRALVVVQVRVEEFRDVEGRKELRDVRRALDRLRCDAELKRARERVRGRREAGLEPAVGFLVSL